MSTTLAGLKTILCGSDGTQGIIQDYAYYAGIGTRINDAVEAIAAGVRLPNGEVSPPLPDLYASGTVSTATDAAYKALPDDYQRHVFMVADSNGDKIQGPRAGDYYSFALFLRQAYKKDLSQSGSIETVCIKGSNLYYQAIPATSEDLTVHYYRVPTAMEDDDDTPDGIPGHLQKRLIQHYVAKEVYGEIEEGSEGRRVDTAYHTAKFFEAMTDLLDFIGHADAEPQYFGYDEGFDW